MTREKDPMSRASPAITPTLGDVLTSLATREDLAEMRRRDLRSAVKRVAALLGDAPERIPLVMPSISARLAKLSAAAAGVSTKTFHNLRSDFLAAVKASGPPLRPGALEPSVAGPAGGAFDPTSPPRPVAFRPLRQ